MAAYPHVNAANKYARDVVKGRISACKWTKLACQRHLDDLQKKRWDYYFDKDAAELVCNIIGLLPHTKGKWARERELIKLEPWQKFIFCSLFGWKRKKDRTRRFREAYCKVPRKNGKSVLAAAVANVMAWCDGEFGAEVYCGATTEKQALEVFKPAKIMVQKTPELIEAFGIEVMVSNLHRPEDGSKLEPLIGNPGDGSSPSCALVDEYHEHDTDALYSTMRTGMGAREQPLMFIITTAGHNIAGPCYDKELECQEMLEGTIPNERLFTIIFGVDDGDDWTDPAVLYKANPNIGVSVDEDFLLSEQRDAVNITSRQNKFKTKHLNIWVQAGDAWINLEKWKACGDSSLKIEEFEGEESWFCLDLASKLDICAFNQLFKKIRDGQIHYYAFGRYYLPEETLEIADTADKKNATAYKRWVNAGYLKLTDGAEINFNRITEDILDLSSHFQVVEVDYDKWRATQLAHRLTEDGANCVEISQAYALSPAMREMEAAIAAGRFHHDNNPVLTWMAGNVQAKEYKGLLTPTKEKNKPQQKIDGIVSLLMGMSRAMIGETQSQPGIVVL